MTGTLIFGDILDDSTRRGVVAFVLLRSVSGGSWLRLYKGALDSLNLNLGFGSYSPPSVDRKWGEDLDIICPKPYSIYLRGTIICNLAKFHRHPRPQTRSYALLRLEGPGFEYFMSAIPGPSLHP